MDNKSISNFSAVVSIVGAVALFAFLGLQLPILFWLSLGGGVIGGALGFIAGRSGANTANRAGLWVGVLVVVACALLVSFFSFSVERKTIEQVEVVEAPSA